ncbi:MAG: hypothetical protein H7841_06405 [Magnetospirillum sp. WYHS-4]
MDLSLANMVLSSGWKGWTALFGDQTLAILAAIVVLLVLGFLIKRVRQG